MFYTLEFSKVLGGWWSFAGVEFFHELNLDFKNMVVVVTTRVQKHEFRDQELYVLSAYV
jgi:hypothetical protein